ncbi:MAG: hypothetical protein RIB84_03365 [Sneathiellaceae bacterium]
MDKFVGTFTNKLDRKGRVSLPAEFRAVLQRQQSENSALMPAPNADAIAGGGALYLDTLHTRFKSPDPMDPAFEDWIDYIMPNVRSVGWDETGRMVLPEPLITLAKLTDTAVFVGRYDHFQIWNPTLWATRQAEVAERQRNRTGRGAGGAQ